MLLVAGDGMALILAQRATFDSPGGATGWSSFANPLVVLSALGVVCLLYVVGRINSSWRGLESEVVERRAAEADASTPTHELALIDKIANAADATQDIGAMVESCLEAICAYTGWPLARSYAVTRTPTSRVVSGKQWWTRDPGRYREFCATLETMRWTPRIGLFHDERASNPARPQVASLAAVGVARGGLRTACAFPVWANHQMVAVLEFFCADAPKPQFEHGSFVHAVTSMLGHALERQRADEYEVRLAAIYQCSADAIVETDPDGVIMGWSPAAERLLGYRFADIAGKPLVLLFPDAEEIAIVSRVLEGNGVSRHATYCRHRDGTRIDVTVAESPLAGADGAIIGMSSVIHEIASSPKPGSDSRANLEPLPALPVMPATAHVGSWTWEIREGRIVWCEEMRRIHAVDWDTFEAVRDGYIALIHPADREGFRTAVRRSLTGGEPLAIKHRITRTDGVERVLFTRGRVIADAQGEFVRMSGTAEDITETEHDEHEPGG